MWNTNTPAAQRQLSPSKPPEASAGHAHFTSPATPKLSSSTKDYLMGSSTGEPTGPDGVSAAHMPAASGSPSRMLRLLICC